MVKSETESALSGFAEVVRMKSENTKWAFKALKQTVKIYFRLGNDKKMLDAYREMLTYFKPALLWYYGERSITNILHLVATSATARQHSELLPEFYQTTLNAFDETKNQRLWFKTNINLCNFLFDKGDYRRMSKILKKLHKSCQKKDGTDDQKKGRQLLEVYAYQFLLFTETKDNENCKMQKLYQKALAIESDNNFHLPGIMGIIRECGGKMHMAERQWQEAAIDFSEAFKYYVLKCDRRLIKCLKYLVLALMLMGSQMNPFRTLRAQPYGNDPEILAMRNLRAAYTQNEFAEFEGILKSNWKIIMDDPFIRTYMEDKLKKVRTPVLQQLVEPYTDIGIPFVSSVLDVPEKEVREILMSLILDGQIDFTINEMDGLLLKGGSANERKLYKD